MTLRQQLEELADEMRSVVVQARDGNHRELGRLVRTMTADLRSIARKAGEVEEAPNKLTQAMRDRQAAAFEQITRSAERAAGETVRDGFDPHGFFVYLLWGHDENTPLYVGLSTNVLARLGSHLVVTENREHIVRVGLIRYDTIDAMCFAEGRLIAHYQPPWNIRGVIERIEIEKENLAEIRVSRL